MTTSTTRRNGHSNFDGHAHKHLFKPNMFSWLWTSVGWFAYSLSVWKNIFGTTQWIRHRALRWSPTSEVPRRKKHGNNSNINNNNYNILQLQQQQPSKDQDNTVNSTLRMVGLCGNADDAKNNTHTQQVGVINFYCVLFNTQGVLTLQAFSSPIYIDFPTKQVWKNKKTNRQQQECQCQCQPCIPHWAACFSTGKIVKLLPIYINACKTRKIKASLNSKIRHQLQRSPIKANSSGGKNL